MIQLGLLQFPLWLLRFWSIIRLHFTLVFVTTRYENIFFLAFLIHLEPSHFESNQNEGALKRGKRGAEFKHLNPELQT